MGAVPPHAASRWGREGSLQFPRQLKKIGGISTEPIISYPHHAFFLKTGRTSASPTFQKCEGILSDAASRIILYREEMMWVKHRNLPKEEI